MSEIGRFGSFAGVRSVIEARVKMAKDYLSFWLSLFLL